MCLWVTTFQFVPHKVCCCWEGSLFPWGNFQSNIIHSEPQSFQKHHCLWSTHFPKCSRFGVILEPLDSDTILLHYLLIPHLIIPNCSLKRVDSKTLPFPSLPHKSNVEGKSQKQPFPCLENPLSVFSFWGHPHTHTHTFHPWEGNFWKRQTWSSLADPESSRVGESSWLAFYFRFWTESPRPFLAYAVSISFREWARRGPDECLGAWQLPFKWLLFLIGVLGHSLLPL